jgi:hypothetical protein
MGNPAFEGLLHRRFEFAGAIAIEQPQESDG